MLPHRRPPRGGRRGRGGRGTGGKFSHTDPKSPQNQAVQAWVSFESQTDYAADAVSDSPLPYFHPPDHYGREEMKQQWTVDYGGMDRGESSTGILGKHKQQTDEELGKKQVRFSGGFGDETLLDSDGAGREEERNQGANGGQRERRERKSDREPHPLSLSSEEVKQTNKKVICVEGTITDDKFFCTLCLAQLNSRMIATVLDFETTSRVELATGLPQNLKKHVFAQEHIKRISALHNKRDDQYFCKICCCQCPHQEVYEQHLRGKKHLRGLQLSAQIKSSQFRPIGELLDTLLKDESEVLEEGDGLSMGLSQSMMSFFRMPGPFIGLQYGVESEDVSGVEPLTFTCTLCNVSIDAGNSNLHFTSSAHRINVLLFNKVESRRSLSLTAKIPLRSTDSLVPRHSLVPYVLGGNERASGDETKALNGAIKMIKKDYPEKWSEVSMCTSKVKKTGLNDKLKEIAAEIESKEGRKIELIRRRILKPKGGKGQSGAQGSSYRGSRGRGGTSFGGRTDTWKEDSPSTGIPHRGGFTHGRGGRGGRGWGGNFTPYGQGSVMQKSGGYEEQSVFQQERGRRGRFPQQTQTHRQQYSQTTPQRPRGRGGLQIQRGRGGESHGATPLQNFLLPLQYAPPQMPPQIFQPPPQTVPTQFFQPPSFHPPYPPAASWQLGEGTPNQQQGDMAPMMNPNPWGFNIPPQPSAVPSQSPFMQQPGGQEVQQPQSPWSTGTASTSQAVTAQPLENVVKTLSEGGTEKHTVKEMQQMAANLVQSEEQAEAALQLSSALTQALLAYRIKSVSSSIPDNPLTTILSSLQGLSQIKQSVPPSNDDETP